MSNRSNHDNRANQLNPNNVAYWEARGWDKRPDDWERRAVQHDDIPSPERTSRKEMKRQG